MKKAAAGEWYRDLEVVQRGLYQLEGGKMLKIGGFAPFWFLVLKITGNTTP